jgi:ATP-dependent protease HslVU (ClpYQ) peptidase subunit
MTLIAAMRDTDGSILIGADSQMTDETSGIRYTVNKLKQHPSGKLAWGTAGAAPLGETLSKWLEAYPSPLRDWESLSSAIRDKIVEINGDQRRAIKRSESEPGPSDGFDTLLAGYIDDTPRMLIIDDCGRSITAPEQVFNAIGAAVQAKSILIGADYTLELLNERCGIAPLDAFLKMKLVLSAVAMEIEGCGLPIHIWRVSNEGIEKLLP